MKIKICGLMTVEDAKAVDKYVPDYAGFVFAEGRRKITKEQAAEFRKVITKDVKTVGVFVNADIDEIEELCIQKTIDVIQLHGDEDEEYINQIKKRMPNEIIKGIRVNNKAWVEKFLRLPADYFLFDSYVEGIYGGSGKTVDYSILNSMECAATKYFIAGGIDRSNLYGIIDNLNNTPYCVDISSGVETNGRKDSDKIKQIIEMVKGRN